MKIKGKDIVPLNCCPDEYPDVVFLDLDVFELSLTIEQHLSFKSFVSVELKKQLFFCQDALRLGKGNLFLTGIYHSQDLPST